LSTLLACHHATLFPYTTPFRSSPASARIGPAAPTPAPASSRSSRRSRVSSTTVWTAFQSWSELASRPVGRRNREPGTSAPVLSRSEEHTSELQSRENLVCRPLP